MGVTLTDGAIPVKTEHINDTQQLHLTQINLQKDTMDKLTSLGIGLLGLEKPELARCGISNVQGYRMKQIDSISPLLLACRLGIARQQSFWHASRLALWRCTTAGDYVELQMMRYAPLSPQSRWCATTQQDFTAWLAAGGFAQEEAQEAQQVKQRAEQLASHREEEIRASTLHETA